MKHNYKAAISDMNYSLKIRHASQHSLFLREYSDTIRHALAMMQKLEEPSLYTINSGTLSIMREFSTEKVLQAMLEQAEQEINQPQGD